MLIHEYSVNSIAAMLTNMNLLQFSDVFFVVWNCFFDKIPEFIGMVKLSKVTEFMDNDVTSKVFRYEGYLVVEV